MEQNTDIIDLRVIIKKLLAKKKTFIIALPCAFVISCFIIFSVPRYYTSETDLAPELSNGINSTGTIGDLASSLGLDISNAQTTDAISPLLYPDLLTDNKFTTDLFNIKVTNSEGNLTTTLYDYLKKHQEKPWWSKFSTYIKKKFAKEDKKQKKNKSFDPYSLSKVDDAIANVIRDDISIKVNKKTGIISVSAKAQDPLICKTLADSVTNRLQEFITFYRTNKAKKDMIYFKKLTAEAKQQYEKARQLYGSYADANTDIMLESFKSKEEDLENDMQLKYNTYTSLNTQLQAAIAKVQEQTPVFTLIKGADVPIKPAGPKRMLFVIGMMFVTFIFCCIYNLKDEIISQLKEK